MFKYDSLAFALAVGAIATGIAVRNRWTHIRHLIGRLRGPDPSTEALDAALKSRLFRPAIEGAAPPDIRKGVTAASPSVPGQAVARLISYNILADGPYYALTA